MVRERERERERGESGTNDPFTPPSLLSHARTAKSIFFSAWDEGDRVEP